MSTSLTFAVSHNFRPCRLTNKSNGCNSQRMVSYAENKHKIRSNSTTLNVLPSLQLSSGFQVAKLSLKNVRCMAAKEPQSPSVGQRSTDILPEEVEDGMTLPSYQIEQEEVTLMDYSGIKKAFVAGANGKTGRKIVEKLVSLRIPVVALVRDHTKAKGVLNSEGVQLVEGDVYQFQTLPKAMKGCDVVLCATGSSSVLDPLGPFNVDFQGTSNLVTAAKQANVKKFVYVTSIGADDILYPLNLLWGVLFWKKRAEEVLQRSGLTYTIVRPGGLLDSPREGSTAGNIIMKGPNTYGTPPRKNAGTILREQVADVCVTSLVEPAAENMVVEIIARKDAAKKSIPALFSELS